MAGAQAVWGIDLGRCALKAVKLRAGADDKVDVLAVDYVEHGKILSQPDANRPELISASLEKFLSRNDLSKDAVVVSVPGQHTLSRFTKLPPVAPKRVPDIVRYEADQQIPFDMDEVIWDYQTFQQEGHPDIEVGIFAMKRELVREHLLHFEQAGIEPIVVQSAPLAVYNACLYEELFSSETTILLDIGAENTDLIIATPFSLWTRTVPIGGNSFTEALVKSFKLSFAKAESLKRTGASSKYARQVFQAMRPIFADLVQELQRSIGFYSSTHRDASIEKVVPMGNAFLLPGLHKYLQQNLGLEVEKPESFQKGNISAVSGNEVFREQFLSLLPAYGLALQGLDLVAITSNLLPTEIAKQAVWRKKRPAFAATAACMVLAGSMVWFRQASDMRALAADPADAQVSTMTYEQAAVAIDNGPAAGLSGRGRAQAILAAGNALTKELRTLSGQGATERAETEQLIQIQLNKSVALKILQVVHDSTPIPDGPIGKATTPTAVRQAIQSGATTRAKRKQIVIDAIDMHFEPNLLDYDWSSRIDVPEPINDFSGESGAELPGMLLKIKCRSPNKGGVEFIRDAFIASLRSNGRKPETGFYFDNIILYEGQKVVISASRSSRQGGFGGRFGGSRGATPQVAPGKHPPEALDAVTHEPMVDDWQFEVWAGVVLEDYPESEDDGRDGDDG